jgi:hypothetical protein
MAAMDSRSRFTTGALLAGLTLLTQGCASLSPGNCTAFEDERRRTNYTTRYSFAQAESDNAARHYKPLPAGMLATVRHYRVRSYPGETVTCRHASIEKEIYIQRSPGANLTLEEVREIHAESGALIATKTENVGSQLRKTGYYQARVPFPLPAQTPPGKYRINSRLMLKVQGSSPVELTRASDYLTVLASR